MVASCAGGIGGGERIATAKVSVSGEEARTYGFLRPTDYLILDKDARISAAKKLAFGLSQAGYKPPAMRTAPAGGGEGSPR